MPRRVPLLVALVGAAAVAALPSAAAAAEAADSVRARFTKYEYRIPMRDGVKLFTVRLRPEGRRVDRRYPILLTRTPYGVAPYGSDNYPDNAGPVGALRQGRLHLRLPGRARAATCPRASSWTCGRTIPAKRGPTDIDEITDTYDTIDWLSSNVPNNNGKVGMWGISYPGFYAAMAR